MTTLVGTQSNFSTALRELAELDYDAIEAYNAAIEKLENLSYQEKLEEFKADHENHIVAINKLLRNRDEDIVEGPGAKKWLTKGRVILATLIDDKSILQAMSANEDDTNTAYERVSSHENKWEEATEILNEGLEDERRHKKWLEDTIEHIDS